MKTIQSKSLLTLIIIFFIIGFSTSAKNFTGDQGDFTDTTIVNAPNRSMYLMENPLRVKYPLILKEHREESKAYITKYSKKERSYIMLMFKRGKNYFPQAQEIFKKYNVPAEFQMLPALESNFMANAVSPAGAVGYWQFMSELAHEYGLRTGGKFDERKNFSKSTVAAAKFFRDQLDFFNNDVLLTVASYNCGQGRVRLALKKSGNPDADFWEVKQYLPAETRRFVMNFLALNVISLNYDKFLNHKLNFEEPITLQLAQADTVTLPEKSLAQNSL
ncbi:MAG: lytic transglycosylase domain-containing protein [Bacteroidetes bacterium]|nr:lytic transglycosylase domain-containing protein [Bacteroidota bacterium]